MRALMFAVRSLVRQPGRTALGIIGIAAVGALLFDMLLLSRGLVVSFRDLLDNVGFDVRVTATDSPLPGGIRLKDATKAAVQVAALPGIAEATRVWRDFFPNREEVYEFGHDFLRASHARA